MKFEQYYISADIKKNLRQMGFKRPTDIQFKTIPSILNGEDVLAIAQTGTGKTAAFAIPVIDKIHRFKTSKRSYGIKCIIMVPTRELALQIGHVFKGLAQHTKVKTFTLHGGIEQEHQIAKIQDGIDILIATPGRMFDLINQDVIEVKNVTTLVLDEADHMLDLGFIEDIKYIKKMLKRAHQTLFFSATINDEIKKLAYSQVKSEAIRIQVSPKDRISKNISHFVMFVELDDKRFFLERFLNDHPEDKIIVFVRTKVRAERVVKAMQRVGLENIMSIHGDKDQQERNQAMQAFRSGACRVLVATDVSARGIDIPDVQFVINYDLPEKEENYVHRIGRTGRGMNKGEAISFCSDDEKELLQNIQDFIQKPVEVLKVSKKGYAEVVKPSVNVAQDLRAMILGTRDEAKNKGKSKHKK
ncbi:MAG: DEAD/DEAH box helicase [Zetaproteobacteria bacterium]|nr:DEAD/DEAH box helicase [Zetaproteobacteria bacterium]